MRRDRAVRRTRAPAARRSLSRVGADLARLRSDPVRLIGRDRDLAEIRALLISRRSIFLSGPAGIGKSAILQGLYGAWDPAREGFPLIYCSASRTCRGIIEQVLVNLLLLRGHLTMQYLGRRRTVTSAAELRRWVLGAGIPELRRMMHQNLHGQDAGLLLDHLDEAEPHVASLIEIWLERMPLALVARDADSMGRIRGLLCECTALRVAPLPAARLGRLARETLRRLAGVSASEADLNRLVRLAAGCPGALLDLLRAAVQGAQAGNGAIRWSLVRIDARMQAAGLTLSDPASGQARGAIEKPGPGSLGRRSPTSPSESVPDGGRGDAACSTSVCTPIADSCSIRPRSMSSSSWTAGGASGS